MTGPREPTAKRGVRVSASALDGTLTEMKRSFRQIVPSRFRLFLFGSHARGDAGPDSDVDLMLVLPDALATFRTKQRIRDVASESSLRTGYVFSVLIVPESLFQERAGFMVFGAVRREGIRV